MGNVVLPHEFQDGIGQVASGDDVMDNLNAIVDQVNGNIDATNLLVRSVNADRLSDVLARLLAISNGSVAPRGKSIVTGQESTSSTSYVQGATPDTVTVDLPADGILWISAYVELEATVAAGSVGLFVDGGLMSKGAGGGGYASGVTFGAFFTPYSTDGATGWTPGSQAADPPGTINTTGLAQIGRVGVPAAAGSRTVSIRYQAGAAGTIFFRNRRLWVEAQGF